MLRLFILGRWLFFGLLVACNAIVCSLAAWNLGLLQDLFLSTSSDAFLISISAIMLLGTFVLIPLDLWRRNAYYNLVWCEASWVAVCFALQLSASAFAQSSSGQVNSRCRFPIPAFRDLPCNSTTAVLVISWISTGILFVYLCALIGSALYHQSVDKNVWVTGVRDFPWYDRACWVRTRSTPSSPVLPTFNPRDLQRPAQPPMDSSFKVHAPKGRRPPPLWVTQNPLSGYQIEHTSPRINEDRPTPKPPQLPPVALQEAMALYPRAIRPFEKSMSSAAPSVRSARSMGKQRAMEPLDIDVPRAESPEMAELPQRPDGRPRVSSQESAHLPSSLPRTRPSGPRTRTSFTGPRPPPSSMRPSLDGSLNSQNRGFSFSSR